MQLKKEVSPLNPYRKSALVDYIKWTTSLRMHFFKFTAIINRKKRLIVVNIFLKRENSKFLHYFFLSFIVCWPIGTLLATINQLIQFNCLFLQNSNGDTLNSNGSFKASSACIFTHFEFKVYKKYIFVFLFQFLMIFTTCSKLAEEASQLVQPDLNCWRDLEKLTGILSCCSLILNITLAIMISNCLFL